MNTEPLLAEAVALAELIEKLYSSPLQADYVAPPVQQAARAFLKHAAEQAPSLVSARTRDYIAGITIT